MRVELQRTRRPGKVVFSAAAFILDPLRSRGVHRSHLGFSGVNKISEGERGAAAHAPTLAAAPRPIRARPAPEPAPFTTGDNNNTIITIMTFIKCLTEGRRAGYAGYVRVTCVPRMHVRGCCSEVAALSRCFSFLFIQEKNAEWCISASAHCHLKG